MAGKNYYGLYQGIVTRTDDPEKRGRIKVLCPSVLGDSIESAWCDPLVNVAYDNGGDFCIPNKDEAVWLQFIEGDANKPVWLGGWWRKNTTPLGETYTDADKIRIINYADCTIVMKQGVISINVSDGDFDLKIENKKVTIQGDFSMQGNLSVNGDISARSIQGTEVKAGGVSLANHTHKYSWTYDGGNGTTEKPS